MDMEYYIEDVINQLVDEAFSLKEKAANEFEKGILFGYYETISKLLNQAESFGISHKLSNKLKDFNPEILIET